MNYPFTSEQFIGVMAEYNLAIWPAQILFNIAALAAVFFLFRNYRYSSKIISIVLAGLWLWMGIVYHWTFFSDINPAARLFAVFFIIEGLLLAYYGIFKSKTDFRFNRDKSSYLGIFLIVVGLLIYPVVGYFLGHTFPDSPTFGLPCPTTIFTLGMILMSRGASKRLILIPFLWSILGFMAAVSFGIKEDVLLLTAGIISFAFILFREEKPKEQAIEPQVLL